MDASVNNKGTDTIQTQNTTNWRRLFSDLDQTLRYHPLVDLDGKSLVVPPHELCAQGIEKWKNAAVIQFVGNNLFIAQFPNVEARDSVVEAGPWHICNQPIVIRRWEKGMDSLVFDMTKMLVWVHLKNVPLELFSQGVWGIFPVPLELVFAWIA